jgi:glycosyltransferase involved in cell wall biosynthesis
VIPNVFPFRKPCNFSGVLKVQEFARLATFSISLNYLIRRLHDLKPDVVLAETSLVGWVTVLASEKLFIPCVIDVHGLIFAEAKGWGRKDWSQKLTMEKEAFEKSNHLIVVSQRMKTYLSEKFGIPAEKMTIIPNGSDPQLSIAHYQYPLRVIYAGIFSYWEKVNDFLDIAKQADPATFNFYLAGEGPMKNQLLMRIQEEHIPIKYLGYIPKQQIREIFAQMQIGIAPSTRDLARQIASPIKIYDYLAAGLPVVTPQIGDWGDLIDNADCGITLKDDTVEEYVKALNSLACESEWIKKSHNAVKAIKEKYSWDLVLKPLYSILGEFK